MRGIEGVTLGEVIAFGENYLGSIAWRSRMMARSPRRVTRVESAAKAPATASNSKTSSRRMMVPTISGAGKLSGADAQVRMD
jgi:hypothetical protein